MYKLQKKLTIYIRKLFNKSDNNTQHSQKYRAMTCEITSSSAMAEGPRDALVSID